ncbi:hypothetical protein, partial [Pseudomonas aeruginosa]
CDALGEGFVGNVDVLDMVFEGLSCAHGVLLDESERSSTVSEIGGGFQPKILGLGAVDFLMLVSVVSMLFNVDRKKTIVK